MTTTQFRLCKDLKDAYEASGYLKCCAYCKYDDGFSHDRCEQCASKDN